MTACWSWRDPSVHVKLKGDEGDTTKLVRSVSADVKVAAPGWMTTLSFMRRNAAT